MKAMKTVINKWNGGLYEVVNDSGNNVELKRDSDGVTFTIAKSEYIFSYKPSDEKNLLKNSFFFSGLIFPFPPD